MSWVTRYPPKGRYCTRCNQFLPFSEFRPNLRLKSGWNSWCRACSAESTKRWRERNADKLRRPPVAPSRKKCVECGASFVGRKDRLLCGARRCKDRRYQRTHLDEYRAKRRRKDARRSARTSEAGRQRDTDSERHMELAARKTEGEVTEQRGLLPPP